MTLEACFTGKRPARAAALAAVALFVFASDCQAGATDVAWTMVVIPDTQHYRNVGTWPIFNQMTQWIVDNKKSRNIEVVLHEGDITDENLDSQWTGVAEAMGRLNGEVPYILSTGNHDYNHPPLKLNDYFSLSDNPLNNSPSGIMTTERIPGDLENVYSTFTGSDGRKMLIFSLEFIPREEVVDWANEIAGLPQYKNHTAVLLTHHYLEEGPATINGEPTPQMSGSGWILWSSLVRKHQNFELTLNGHALDGNDSNPYGKLTTARMARVGDNGNTVHSMVFNSQEQPAGGNGYMRILEFLDDGKTVQARTYSPYLDQWLTNDRNQFQVELLSLYAGDFNDDGIVDGSDYTVWNDNLGTSNILPNDPTPGVVDESDFDLWSGHFGNSIYTGDFNNDGTVNDHDYDIWLANVGTTNILPNDPTPGIVDDRDLMLWQNHRGRSIYASYYNGFYGDFNGDGVVDAVDYTVWRDNVGTNAILYNDPTIGVVDESDFELWRGNFGNTVYLGDFNGDGNVDAADYVVWRDNVNTDTILPNDPTPGIVDESDFELWRSRFGNGTGLNLDKFPINIAPWATAAGSGAATSAVPEPGTATLAIVLPAILLACGRRLRLRRGR